MNPIRRLRRPRRWQRLGSSTRGTVALEFALVVPTVLLLLTGGADIVQWLRAWFRVERAASEVATVASQFQALTRNDITMLFNAGQQIAGTISVSGTAGGQVMSLVSSNGDGTGNLVTWQCRQGAFASRVGATGGAAALPAGFLVPQGQTVLVSEAFTRRTPWILSAGFIAPAATDVIYSYTVVRPRSAQLSSPPTLGCPT